MLFVLGCGLLILLIVDPFVSQSILFRSGYVSNENRNIDVQENKKQRVY